MAPDEVTYNTLIAAHGGAGDLEAAIGVFADMQRNGLVATPRTYTTLMAACARAGRRDVAARLLALMHAEGLAPAVQTYTALLDACVKVRLGSFDCFGDAVSGAGRVRQGLSRASFWIS